MNFVWKTEDKEEAVAAPIAGTSSSALTASTIPLGLQGSRSRASQSPVNPSTSIKTENDVKLPTHALSTDPEEAYTLFMGSNNWYLFLRLHQILCERLTKMYERGLALAAEEARYKQSRKESIAVALRLKPKSKFIQSL